MKTKTSDRMMILQERIGYCFADSSLLEEAMTHSSYINEVAGVPCRDNERLEFFGDAVLSLFISQRLLSDFPDKREGELSRLRSSMVDEKALARMAVEYGIGDALRLGKGEDLSGGRRKPSMLADAYEALLAALYLDGGDDALRPLIDRHYQLFAGPGTEAPTGRDCKTELQELLQARGGTMPRYSLTGTTGPDHARTFTVALYLGDEMLGEGSGKSKKEAEQKAAAKGLESLRATASGRV